jgi:hypothetical protein
MTLRLLCLLPVVVVLLVAGDPWKEKPVAQWTEGDSRQLLADSPWVRYVTPERLRDLSPSERRDSGDWDAGIGKGVGLAGTGILGPRRQAEAIARAHQKPTPKDVAIRWESAIPVRIAEKKAGETDVPVLNTDGYAIAVYDIPTPKQWNLANELKGIAVLKRYKKKDIKPSHVEILRHDDGTATIVYLFPRSIEITKRDGGVELIAQIGRLVVSQYFYTDEMQINGELEVLMPNDVPR